MRALAAALLLIPALAFAQQGQRVQKVIFGDDVIDGTGTAPETEQVLVKRPTTFPNLIKLRRDFNDKIRQERLP